MSDRPAWGDQSPGAYDRGVFRTAAKRRVADTAPETLFPGLLPAPDPRPAARTEIDGQAGLFGGDL